MNYLFRVHALKRMFERAVSVDEVKAVLERLIELVGEAARRVSVMRRKGCRIQAGSARPRQSDGPCPRLECQKAMTSRYVSRTR